MSNPKFPLEYRTVHLYDELKYLALREQLSREQQNTEKDTSKVLILSSKIDEVINTADRKRTAFYSKESIHAFFGIQGHLRKQGFFGKVLAYLINPTSYSKYFN